MTLRRPSRVVITGAGVVSAAGCSLSALAESLDRRRHCLTPISLFETQGLAATHAGQVEDFAPLDALPPVQAMTVDRGTQMAFDAARQALAQAALTAEQVAEAGLGIGVSGSPQYQNLAVFPNHGLPASRRTALYLARTTPHFQADFLARAFNLGGPRFAFGSASLGGMLAIGHAVDLLRAGHASVLLVGGGEIHTLMNALGMNMLGVAATGPCTPFTETGDGMCFGEGAAFFVLERLTDAVSRGAEPLLELAGVGISADAYGDLAQDPAGRGLARAVRKSLAASSRNRAMIGWVRACGTGRRDLDAAETIGLHAAFDGATPPITSTEPYFGHVNGVSPLLGLAAVVVALRTNRAPCVPKSGQTAAGSAASLLQPGPLPEGDCLLTATAFGGSNGALVVRRLPGHPTPAASGSAPDDDGPAARVVIAGMGAVSALGGTLERLLSGLAAPPSRSPVATARLVDDAWLGRKLTGIPLARRTRLIRMALLAVHEALASAHVVQHDRQRFGLLVGLTRGPMAAYERFLEQTLRGVFDASTGRSLLRSGRFSVASEIARAFGLQGYSGTLASGVHGGVHTLAHAAELLRASADLDGLLVVAADEWTALLETQYRRLGLLADAAGDQPNRSGCIGGEGAAAVLLCRRPPAPAANGAGPVGHGATDWAVIEAAAFAGDTSLVPDPAGRSYGRTMRAALRRSGRSPGQIHFAFGQSCGWPAYDQRERAAFDTVFPGTPLTSVMPHTGLAESASGLFGAMAAAAKLRAQPDRQAMLIGSTERGAHAAVVLSGMAA